MYCPKCSTQNQDDLAYCRGCGENLLVISQALKKHLSIALVSKLDAVIEKKNELFRRDAILNGLMGAAFLFSTVLAPLGARFYTLFNVSFLLLGIFALLSGAWNFLAYRRGKELKLKSPGSPAIYNISQIAASPDTGATTRKLNAAKDDLVETGSIYCPKCGLQNFESGLYCHACGTNLDFSDRPQGMEKYLPSFLVNKLDARIAKNEVTDYKPQYKSGRTLLIVAFIYLINIILRGTQGDWANMTVYLVMGFVMVVSAGWNLIAYRRSTEKENSSLNEPSTSFTGGPQTLFPLRSKIALALLCFSLGAVYFGMAAGWVLGLFALIVIAASFLKFWQNQKDRQFLTSTAATTDRLRPPKTLNTSPFAQSPPSVTEATTSFLEPMANQIKQEEIETDQDLVNRNR